MSDGRGFEQAVRAIDKFLAEHDEDEPAAAVAGAEAEPADAAAAPAAEI